MENKSDFGDYVMQLQVATEQREIEFNNNIGILINNFKCPTLILKLPLFNILYLLT